MKPEDVPLEWRNAAYHAYFLENGQMAPSHRALAAALAAALNLALAQNAAYAAGAEAMREAAAVKMAAGQPYSVPGYGGGSGTLHRWWAEDAAAAIRSLPLPASAWRAIETAPRDGARALFYAPTEEDRAAVWRIDYWWGEMRAWAHMRPGQPYTHWMPLPEAPE